MLSPPDGLADDILAPVLRDGWDVTATSLRYLPVGFGSHHWDVVDDAGARWFVTADELDRRGNTAHEPVAAAFDRLRAALATARALRDAGARYVVAPRPSVTGEPVWRARDRFGVALYPWVDGRSFAWDDVSPSRRRALVEVLVELHTGGGAARGFARADDFGIRHRDALEAAVEGDAPDPACGPFAAPAGALLAARAPALRAALGRYDELVAECRAAPCRPVVTHGEPHPGNTILTAGGLVLVDWDTVLLAPPERDLWSVDPGDGSVLAAYADATGTTLAAERLELYRLRWDLTDIGEYAQRFRAPHRGDLDDDKSWDELRAELDGLRW